MYAQPKGICANPGQYPARGMVDRGIGIKLAYAVPTPAVNGPGQSVSTNCSQRGLNMLKKLLPSLIVLCAGFAAAPVQASDFIWSDTYLNYRYLWADKQPGAIKEDTIENAINLSHADGWKYGQNFFSFDLEEYSRNDPNNVAFGPNPSSKSSGSGEFYGLFRSTFSGNKIFATKAFSFSPIIKDIGLEIGGDWCTQNDANLRRTKSCRSSVRSFPGCAQGIL